MHHADALDGPIAPGIRHRLEPVPDDLPMDFADASLVHVANREKVGKIFTLDRRDFGIYRLKRRQSFTIVPK